MIYSEEWNKKREELRALLENYRKNVEFCGSEEVLMAKYPGGYKKLKKRINEVVNDYIMIIFKDAKVPPNTDAAQILGCWKPHEMELREAIKDFSEEKVLVIMETFLSEIVMAFNGSLC